MKRFGLAQLLVLLSLAGTVVVNALAVTLPIGGLTTAEVSALYPALFVPAGYVFSIWGVIYLGLGVYAVAQAVPPLLRDDRVRSIAWPFVLSGVLNSVWLVLWQNLRIYLTVPVMVALLLTLIAIYGRLRGGIRPSSAERWLVRLPFSVYLGWITVATIANVTDALYAAGWGGWGVSDVAWAVILLAVGTLIGLVMLARRGDVGYALVLVWAFVGIAVEQRPEPPVALAALVAAVLVALGVVVLAGRGRRREEPVHLVRGGAPGEGSA